MVCVVSLVRGIEDFAAMAITVPSLSTDQVAAFVELARQGSLRRASEVLLITEQGVRNRLIALETRLQVELYHKGRGMRQATPLTPQGRQFLPHAIAFLEQACELTELFHPAARPRDVHVAVSQYLLRYVLIDAARRFHARFPQIRIRLSVHAEQEIENVLLRDPDVALGVAAPYEPPAALHYRHVFSMSWSLITPRRHPLARQKTVKLSDLVTEPLIVFERGSTGRQHIFDAFHAQGLSPSVHMETTTTEIVIRMVEADLGVSIVPLLPGGVVTRGCRVAIRPIADPIRPIADPIRPIADPIRPIADPIRPIHSGILTRQGETLSAAASEFVGFISGRGRNSQVSSHLPNNTKRQR